MADKEALLKRFAETEEDRLLLARLYDRLTGAEQRGIPAFTHFLAPREQALLSGMLAGFPLTLFGGYDEAERKLAAYLPDYMPGDSLTGKEGPVAVLRVRYYEKTALTHRDFLGSLLGCGIKRELLGDILVGEGSCDILVCREMAAYLLDNYTAAGRTALKGELISLSELSVPAVTPEILRVTVASLRLDAVLAAGFRLARGKAAEAIAAGRVSVNDLPCEKPDRPVAPGDKLTLRGLGRLLLEEEGGRSKKDRLGLVLKVYGKR